MLLLLGIYIVISSFSKRLVVPPGSVLILLVVVFLLKLIAIVIMHKIGDKINSQVLITSVKESKADLYSTIGVFIITILLQFSDKFGLLKYSDIVGSILIGIIVLKTAFTIIVDNSLSLIGEVEEDPDIVDKVNSFIKNIKGVKDTEISLIKYGSYYKLQLNLVLDSKLSLRQVTRIENRIKKDIIRHRSLNIKYVTIYVTNSIIKK